jgi:hypothetical protein
LYIAVCDGAYQYFWIAFVVLCIYLAVLYKLVALIDTNFVIDTNYP